MQRFVGFSAVLGALALFVGGAATAAPSLSLVWTGTSGSGTTGGSTIDASNGDTLTLDVVLTIDAAGFTGAAWDLVGSAGMAASATTLLGAPGFGGPPECPAPPSVAPGTCFSSTFKSFVPLSTGVSDVGSSTTGYDVAGLTAEFLPQTFTIGRGVFVVNSSGSETVTTFYAPGVGGVTDGLFAFSVPAVATATAIIPEPGTAGLMGLGLLSLALAGRRR